MDLASIPQRVCSNNLIPPPLCSSWIRHEGGTENKASRTKAEATIKQRRWCLCKNARLSHCPSECLLVPVSYPGYFFFARSVWRSCSRFPPRAGLHRKAGWLAGGTGKETASVKRQMEDSMCLRRRNANNTQMCRPAQIWHKYIVKIVTQMGRPRRWRVLSLGYGGSPSDLWPFGAPTVKQVKARRPLFSLHWNISRVLLTKAKGIR